MERSWMKALCLASFHYGPHLRAALRGGPNKIEGKKVMRSFSNLRMTNHSAALWWALSRCLLDKIGTWFSNSRLRKTLPLSFSVVQQSKMSINFINLWTVVQTFILIKPELGSHRNDRVLINSSINYVQDFIAAYIIMLSKANESVTSTTRKKHAANNYWFYSTFPQILLHWKKIKDLYWWASCITD